MVQNKKNFSSDKKSMNDQKDLGQKSQTRTADRSADSIRSGNLKQQSGQSKGKADIAKRDTNSRE